MANCQNEILDIIANENLETQPGTKVKYSDLNFLTLGFLVERFYGTTLDAIAASEIFKPLNLTRTFFVPPNRLQNEIAAAEFGNNYEKQTCLEMGYQIPNPELFRSELIWGAVHDGNARLLNGIAPHAGLFSTAEEVFKIALQFLPNSTTLLKPVTCELFKTNFTPDLNEARSLAFQLAATEDSTASEALAKNSFGHLGFTGTSLWIEPERERIFILLTNRTHRPLPFVNINSTRRRFHELATVDFENL
jgi:CubicO group peptidase (beta-lactamase class C family)